MLDRITRERGALSLTAARRLVLLVLAFVPYALGWCAGLLVTVAVWVVAAVVTGYKEGRR